MRPFYAFVAKQAPKLGFNGVRRLAAIFGACMWHLVGSRRKLATNALQHHLHLTPERACQLARQSFTHNFNSFLELFLVGRVTPPFIHSLRESRPGVFAKALEFDGPIVGITAHLGAWELLGGVLGREVGRTRDALVVVRRNKNADLHELITHFREAGGARVVDHRQAVFTVLKTLKRKGFAAFLVDHNCPRNEAIFLPFLQDTAAVNMGPAVLAVRANAAIMPVFMTRDEEGGFTMHAEELLTPDQLHGSRDDKIRQVAEFYTRTVERYVTAYPEQWFWMHKRWKTRPEASHEPEQQNAAPA